MDFGKCKNYLKDENNRFLKSSVERLSRGGERHERLRSGSSLGLLWAKGFDRRKAQGKLKL